MVRMDQLHSLGQFCLPMFGGLVFNTVYTSIRSLVHFYWILLNMTSTILYLMPHCQGEERGSDSTSEG